MGQLVKVTQGALAEEESSNRNIQQRNLISDSLRFLNQHEAALVKGYPMALLEIFAEGPATAKGRTTADDTGMDFGELSLMDESEMQAQVELSKAQQSALHATDAVLAELNTLVSAAQGLRSVVDGFHDGARNMIGIGAATATAGVIVGAITLTGLGLRMTEFVEFVAQGNVMMMLLFIAFVCLVLGLGVPTTANYVLVATLMAPVVVELGARSGLVIPLIAVHLFVFYYGIMGDITPPVGLATFAAAAISHEDAIQTGIQGSLYALRTVILPFIWIFNTQLLLIDVHGWGELVRVVLACTLATLLFAAVTMLWFRVKSRWWETLVLLAAVALLFRPDFFMDQLAAPYRSVPAAQVFDVARDAESDATLVLRIKGTTIEGEEIAKTVAVQLGAKGEDGRKRLAEAGLQLVPLGDAVQIGQIKFGSRARKGGFEQGWDVATVELPTDRPSPHWFYLPALALAALVWWAQGRRMKAVPPPPKPNALKAA